MSKVQVLRLFANQRLTAAAEEIFELFERTATEYEEQLCRLKEENEQLRKLVDSGLSPEARSHQADVVQLTVIKEEVPPEQQERSSSPIQENPPEPPHIKEDQDGEQLKGPEEADISMLLRFTPVALKSEEEDDEIPQSSWLNEINTNEGRDIEHLKTEADGEDCGGPEPDRDFNPDSHLQPVTPDKTSHLSGSGCETDLQNHMIGHSENNSSLVEHPRTRKGEKPFACSVCKAAFGRRSDMVIHMRKHTGEKPYSCSVCGKRFARNHLKIHMRTHTGEKPFSCLVCGKRFAHSGTLLQHMNVHDVEKPFDCLVCGKSFAYSTSLKRHMTIHGP
ncbi:zinc finger protein 391 isoform X2 [Labrus bergylta]|uniref:zinc finger protein 391 isoform X2 n=1 Tax=Labrus bergylta TaxID=56723 RepID=UPI0033134330